MWLVSVLVRWAVLTGAVVLAAWATPDVDLRGGALWALWVAVLISLANVAAQLVMRLLPTPDSVLLLAGLTLAVNGAVVWAVSAVTSRLDIDGFVAAVTFALMVSVFSVALGVLAGKIFGRDDA
jgi:putative membrane protein